MHPATMLALPILLTVVACQHPVADDSGTALRDSEPPPPDACDDRAGEQFCWGSTAYWCDATGDVAETQVCEVGVCEAGVGCVACSVDLLDVMVVDEDEDSVGLVLVESPLAADAPFEQQRLVSREVVVEAAAGDLRLNLEGEGVWIYDQRGTVLEAETLIVAEDLPYSLYLVGQTSGAEASLRATHALEGCGSVQDELRLRVATIPGLAGSSLPSYPFFLVHDVFAQNGQIEAAVDPGRLSDRIGQWADIHVVAHRSAEAWAADPTLVDITGEVERLTVSATSMGEFQVEAWSDALDGGDELSQDYDLVLDFDGDGALGPGDLVDGLGEDHGGLTVFRDLTQPGPHEVVTLQYSGGSWKGQRTYHPADIGELGLLLPLVVISHGNGHDYTWYDYLGEHLASHGYVVMAHQNNTGPGIETASTTTLTNTDYFLGALELIGDGALAGHVDPHTIVWVGHSRGGEGVVRAYDRLWDGDWICDHYSVEDIVLVSSIAPTVFNSVLDSDPHDVTYHLLAGAADGDVTGGVNCSQCQFLRIAAAAMGDMQVTYLQGAGHNDFNCCGWTDATGPDQVGRPEAQQLAKATYLALLSWYVGGHDRAGAYLQRMPTDLRYAGLADTSVVASVFRSGIDADKLVLDDHQVESNPALSTAGGAVGWDVEGMELGLLDDGDSQFAWNGVSSMNGMTWVEERDDRDVGRVFEWSEGQDLVVEWEVPEAMADWGSYGHLSFRACQVTRHPNTVALDGPLDFSVALMDGDGNESAVGFGGWGGLTRPYQRTGLGSGSGWANEFNTVRIPLYAFDSGGVVFDLADVRAVRLELGETFGTSAGAIGIDDLEVVP